VFIFTLLHKRYPSAGFSARNEYCLMSLRIRQILMLQKLPESVDLCWGGTVNLSRTVQNITSSLGSKLLIVGRGRGFQKPKTGQLSIKLTVPPNCKIIDVGIVGENYRPTTNTEGVYNDEHTCCIGN
jgi:hypothetical protein